MEVFTMGILDLRNMDDEYAAAEAITFEEVPNGRYQCRIIKAEPGITKTTSNPMIKWTLVVLAGECKNRKVFKNMVFTPNSLGLVKNDLQALKFTGKISQLESALPRYINQAVQIRRSQNGTDNQGRPQFNTYFEELLNIPLTDGVDYAPPPDDRDYTPPSGDDVRFP